MNSALLGMSLSVSSCTVLISFSACPRLPSASPLASATHETVYFNITDAMGLRTCMYALRTTVYFLQRFENELCVIQPPSAESSVTVKENKFFLTMPSGETMPMLVAFILYMEGTNLVLHAGKVRNGTIFSTL